MFQEAPDGFNRMLRMKDIDQAIYVGAPMLMDGVSRNQFFVVRVKLFWNSWKYMVLTKIWI